MGGGENDGRERERCRESESFDSSSLRLQRRKSETEFPCRVYPLTDLDERCAAEIQLNSENAYIGNCRDIFGKVLSLRFLCVVCGIEIVYEKGSSALREMLSYRDFAIACNIL